MGAGDDDRESDACRRMEELDALRSFYGDGVEVLRKKKQHEEFLPSSSLSSSPLSDGDEANGPWRIHVSSNVQLDLVLPTDYPSRSAPHPILHAPAWILHKRVAADLVEELLEMWSEEVEVAILWAEHCRTVLANSTDNDDNGNTTTNEEVADTKTRAEAATSEIEGVQTFYPHTSKYSQSVRHFDRSVIHNEAHERFIYRGKPFHPPKSGPSETMLAHVATVHSMDQVNWVLAQLLFNDKKVAKATHNMIAYRFWDTATKNSTNATATTASGDDCVGCLVSDNDDDGEKGAGAKLAALLEMTDTINVIVVVSRWFGGVKLGPSRFKHIASTARKALEEADLLPSSNKK